MTGPEREDEEAGAMEAAPAVIAPASPQGLKLEGELPHVMRLSRKTLAFAGGAACFAIGGTLLWALRTPDSRTAQVIYEVTTPGKSEAITGAAADYGAVPRLGPPLPGDLGRPIVSAQKAGEAVPVPAMAGPPSDPRIAAAEQARQRALQERDAAGASRLFLGGGAAVSGRAERSDTIALPAPDVVKSPDTVAAARKAFLARGEARARESSERIVLPSSARIIQAGTVIPAALITGIRSDLPGQVTAQVTQNIYDSPTGRILLIPQGARLVGDYDSEIGAGQERVLLAWDRLILPGGASIALARQPGADAAGLAGLADRVDHHWGRMLRAALVSTLLGIGADLGSDSNDRLARALREGSQDSVSQTGRQLVERELRVPPTLTIRPGHPLRVIVTQDLILEPAGEGL